MNRKTSSIIIYVIIGLAVIGFIFTLMENPSRLISMVVSSLIIIGIMVFILNTLMNSNPTSRKEQRSFIKAAKASKKKYQHKRKTTIKGKSAIKKRDISHLTVIEGNKGKKKNRALH
ncbi:SA1362 family protein [Bacillus kwashiorkori]|uniref:SA1362 family protein n=1 Tax=Bacillus kwashiorkori TaxID=1522318 RepID=UPI000782C481|nr:SA1362 family protein [Bacillus kwashiorkori]